MKIVFLHDDFPPESAGGAGMVAASLAKQLHVLGHDVSVITATASVQNVGKDEWEGVSVYRVYSSYHERWRAWRSLYNPSVVKEVERLLTELKPEIVHAHNVHYHLSYASLVAAKQSGARVFLTVHDVMTVQYGKFVESMSAWRQFLQQRWRYNPFRNFFIRYALKNVDRIFAVSTALKSLLEQRGIHVTAVLYNGIDSAQWEIGRDIVAAFTQNYGLNGKKIMFFGGRVSALKGGDALAAALPAIVRAVPEAILLVAGKENGYLHTLERHMHELGVEDALKSTGWISGEDLKAAYHASDVVVQPSIYFEPFGLIALEGMACGKPTVVGYLGGLPEVVQNGETGYVVNPHDTKQLSDKIIELLSDTALAEKMGQAGHHRACELFSLEQQTLQLLSWYEK